MMNSDLHEAHVECSQAECNDKNQKGNHFSKASVDSQEGSEKKGTKTNLSAEDQEEKGR